MTTTTRWTPALWALLFVLSGNMLIDALEVSIAVVALPSIGTDLSLPPPALHWTITSFALGFGGFLLVGARIVARLGRRRVYLGALLGFAAATVVGATTADATLFLVTRFVTGVCVALTAPTGMAIIAGTFAEGPARGRAVSVYALFGASGFSVGLVLAGLLTGISWRATFLFPAPVAVALFVAGWWLIPRDGATTGTRGYDLAGAAALVGAAVLLPVAVTLGVDDPRGVVALGLTVVLAGVFVAVERVADRPLVRLGILRRGPLVRSILGAATLNGSYWGFLYVVTLQLQGPADWSPLQTGLAILPASVLPVLVVPVAGRLIARVGAARLIAIGATASPVGYVLYLVAEAGEAPAYPTAVLPAMLLVGFGFALGFAALHLQAMTGVAADDHAMVSGTYQTAVQLGGVVVLTGTATLFAGGGAGALLLVVAVGTAGVAVSLAGVVLSRAPATEDR